MRAVFRAVQRWKPHKQHVNLKFLEQEHTSTPHLAPDDVVRLNSIQAFQVIDLIFAINFSIWACTFMKK